MPDEDLASVVVNSSVDGTEEPGEHATAGSVELTIHQLERRVSGFVSATPDSMSATFDGTFQVWCHALGTDGEFVLDEAFSTPFCSPYARWKLPS